MRGTKAKLARKEMLKFLTVNPNIEKENTVLLSGQQINAKRMVYKAIKKNMKFRVFKKSNKTTAV